MKLTNKSILITGGATGIGLEAAKQFSALGLKVIICGRRTDKLVQANSFLPSINIIRCDITNDRDIEMLEEYIKDLGGIDILYNNAAIINDYNKVNNSYYEYAQQEIATNYLSVVKLNERFEEALEKKQGAIINTTSAVAYVPSTFVPTYSASKAALHSYTISLRENLKKKNSSIKVFELIPPTVDTEVVKDFKAKKVSPQLVIKTLIRALQKDKYTINVSFVKALLFVKRFSEKKAFKIVNP